MICMFHAQIRNASSALINMDFIAVDLQKFS